MVYIFLLIGIYDDVGIKPDGPCLLHPTDKLPTTERSVKI